jgi:diketogulonate reductase-like aldo/keto reductase
MKIPKLIMNDGNQIPQIGLGLWQVKDRAEFDTAFNTAIKVGYRHFDTAQAYENEQYLGEDWRASGLKREELFITTKIAVQNFGYKKAKRSFDESLRKLQTDYVDLLLLHFPVTILRKKSWLALEEIREAGQAKSIGVSNYTIRHLEEMKNYAKIMPAVNQIELHVFLQQPELIKYCQANDIVVEAYSPLVRGRGMDDPTIVKIAKKHGKSPAQIMLRWCLEQDLVILPKSVTPERIKQNLDVFDFKLDKADMAELAKLNQDMRTNWSPVHVP